MTRLLCCYMAQCNEDHCGGGSEDRGMYWTVPGLKAAGATCRYVLAGLGTFSQQGTKDCAQSLTTSLVPLFVWAAWPDRPDGSAGRCAGWPQRVPMQKHTRSVVKITTWQYLGLAGHGLGILDPPDLLSCCLIHFPTG